MLSYLKQWILTAAETRPARRRAGLPHFHGQIEKLETRSLLSASIGAMPEYFETGAIAVVATWESGYFESIPQPQLMPHGPLASHWEDARPNGDWLPGPAQLGQSGWGLQFPEVNSSPQYVIHVFVVWSSNPQYSLTGPDFGDFNELPSGYQSNTHTSNNGAIAGMAPPGGPSDRLPMDEPPRYRASFDATGAYSSLLVVPLTTTSAASTSAATTVGARDAVFQAYSSESLLLAAGVDELRDIDAKVLDDDVWESDEEEQDAFLGLSESGLRDDVAASLDALERQREAIDAVLADLHNVELRVEQQKRDAAHGGRQPDATTHVATAEDIPFAAVRNERDLSHDPAEGGMVLLAASGDANRGAYDLTAVILGGPNHAADETLGIEASVGVYQAFDVGGGEQRPSGKHVGQSTPAATVSRTSASAENASAKKSEQSS